MTECEIDMVMQPGNRPRPVKGVLGKDLGDEYLFYDSDGDEVHTLNGPAREIYLLCDGTRTLEEIADAVVESYEIDAETALEDVGSTVERLIGLGFLR
jgi:pyrroloquinoline quinone biosynthesis protein D